MAVIFEYSIRCSIEYSIAQPSPTDDTDAGPFLLTLLLLDLLTADETSRSRVVNVAGHSHHRAAMIDYDDVTLRRQNYRPSSFYAHSKLANILFTRELARRLGEWSTHLAYRKTADKTSVKPHIPGFCQYKLL